MHIEFLLEEPSAEAFFADFLPKIVPAGTTWKLIPFQGKMDLLANLEKRLKGYAAWLPEDWRIVVLVDEDRENCVKLKGKLDAAAKAAGLATKGRPKQGSFVVLTALPWKNWKRGSSAMWRRCVKPIQEFLRAWEAKRSFVTLTR